MEYYVSGTRRATRDEIYRKDIEPFARCRGATHVVYAFNLGAFALGSLKEVRAEVGATVWGIGAGGASKSVNNAEKKGGVLTSCTGETARETATCRVPIRLTLREISNGENPDAVAARAPETPDALNLAGKVDQKLKMSEEAHGRYKAALERMQARDGKACLKELNAYDKLDPKNASTGARSPLAFMRGTCVMMSGMCDAGKVQLRKAYEATNQIAAEHIDGVVDSNASTYCQGGSMSPRDQLLKASHDLQLGATTKKDVAFCRSASDTVKHLSTTVKANGDEDHAYQMATNEMSNAMNLAGCYGRAGDCSLAFKEWHVGQERLMGGAVKTSEYVDRANFARSLPACKTWVESVPMSPRDQLVKAIHGLQEASSKQPDTATCRTQIDAIVALRGRVDASVPEAAAAREPGLSTMGMQCFAKAGDCTNAYRMFMSAGASSYPENQRKQIFEASVPSCKGK